MSSPVERSWEILEERLLRVLGSAAEANAQNTDRLQTWGTFLKLEHPVGENTWSYQDELSVLPCESGGVSDLLSSACKEHTGPSIPRWDRSTSTGGKDDSELSAAQNLLNGQVAADENPASANDSASSDGAREGSPPRKRMRQQSTKFGDSGSSVEKDERNGQSEGGSSESDSGTSSSENSGESSASSGASGLRRMRERMQGCQREMQARQRLKDGTQLRAQNALGRGKSMDESKALDRDDENEVPSRCTTSTSRHRPLIQPAGEQDPP